VERYLPSAEMDMKMHLAGHMPQQVLVCGTLNTAAQWHNEHSYGSAVRLIGNRTHPEQDMLHKVRKCIK
jgi:hypothetical protein